MVLSDVISVHSPKTSLRLADLGYKAVTLIGLVFTVIIIAVIEVIPLNPQPTGRLPVTWVQPDNEPSAWRPRRLPRNLQTRDQADPELIRHIREQWILRPSGKPRNLAEPNRTDFSQHGQSAFYDGYLAGKTRGFYVEAGAFDGEKFSDSLFFETQRDWSGLLIEANPQVFRRLLGKQRAAYALNACLSPTNRPIILNFTAAGILGGITGLHKIDELPNTTQYIEVQCLPLYSIMAAMGNRHVDILFLDVEGAEYDVVQSLSLRDVNIDVINVEVLMTEKNSLKTQRKLGIIESVLSRYGYHRLDTPFWIDLAMSKIRT